MADDSLEIVEPLKYHPCDTPRGCTYYDTKMLTDCQQLKLNQLKLATIKSDEQYLHTHPEIRGFVALITRHIFKQQPRRDLPLMIKEFFDRPVAVIEDELEEYIKSRPPIEPEVQDEGIDEEAINYREDLDKYLVSMEAAIEEKPATPKKTTSDKVDTNEFIKQLLLDRIRTFPSDTKTNFFTDNVSEFVFRTSIVAPNIGSLQSVKIRESGPRAILNTKSKAHSSHVSIVSSTEADNLQVLESKVASNIMKSSRKSGARTTRGLSVQLKLDLSTDELDKNVTPEVVLAVEPEADPEPRFKSIMEDPSMDSNLYELSHAAVDEGE